MEWGGTAVKDIDDLADAIDEAEDKKQLVGALLKRYWKLLLVLVGVAAVAVLVIRGNLAVNRQKELEEQLAQQTEMLERNQTIINSLTKQQEETEKMIRDSVPIITSELLQEQMGPLAELVTEQYIYTNADGMEADQTWIFGWTRPFSSKKIVIKYDGTIKAGVDLSKAVIEINNRLVNVTLPHSQITQNDIPQESISVIELKDGLFNEVTFEDYNEFVSQQKIVMEQKVIARGLLDEADEEAVKIVKSFLEALPGMSDYRVKVVVGE